MYPSDYGYAAGSSCLSTALYDYNSSCKNSDYLFSGVYEWLQAPNAIDSKRAARLSSTGYVIMRDVVTSSYAVRPVLYLNTNVKIIGGIGTKSEPYLIDQ